MAGLALWGRLIVNPVFFRKASLFMTIAQGSETSTQTHNNVDMRRMANALRALAMDAVETAQSGHPGMPMGMADVAAVLYAKFLKFDPKNPEWADRDRFVLSAGHGSMLIYGLNYLTGYDKFTLEEIKNFRQMGAITAGHPEIEHDAGIEVTTGPLGQGISMAVGLALAERIMNARFGDDLVDHHTYVIASDGDLMEGVSHESCSFAGHMGLEKLIVLYDDNGISIDGPTSLSFTDDTPKRFESYGWDVQEIDGHDFEAIEKAIAWAKTTNAPSLIACKTKIGYGAPTKENSASSHGAPLGEEEIKGARENLGWAYAPFDMPEDVMDFWRGVGARGGDAFADWSSRYENIHQTTKHKFDNALNGDVAEKIAPVILDVKRDIFAAKPNDATRKSSGKVLEKLVPAIPELIGGSADLTGSNNTKTGTHTDVICKNTHYTGQYIYYGVREHGMTAVMNGMAVHGGVIPYGGTFLVFTDFCRPSIRLAALMAQRSIFVMTHDSIGLGEDGPTHQPVEHVASLRAMPNLHVFRPCDGIETAESWEIALNSQKTPSVLALTRQGVPTLCRAWDENKTAKGAYILYETEHDSQHEIQVTLFASGSEVAIAKEAYDDLEEEGYRVRLVSVPCMDLFWQQDPEYIQGLICNKSIKIAVEAGVRQGWERFIGPHGTFIGMESFGASAPAAQLYRHFGITSEAVAHAARKQL
jgi:transketolase